MAGKNSGPYLPDVQTLIAAGLDPKTGMPVRMASMSGSRLAGAMEEIFFSMDVQDSVSRYEWTGLPDGLDSEYIERLMYFKGQFALFYSDADKRFYALPYALGSGKLIGSGKDVTGTIDVQGRYTVITPLPFNGGTTSINESEQREKEEPPKPWINGLVRVPVYREEDASLYDKRDAAVLFYDYPKEWSQTTIPRFAKNRELIRLEAQCIPMMKTALLTETGVEGMRCAGTDEEGQIQAANAMFESAALNGTRWIGMRGSPGLESVGSSGSIGRAQEFTLALQSLDNLRLSTYGLATGGVFEKKAHVLEREEESNAGQQSKKLMVGLQLRKTRAAIANAVFGLNIGVNISGGSSEGVDVQTIDDREVDVDVDA